LFIHESGRFAPGEDRPLKFAAVELLSSVPRSSMRPKSVLFAMVLLCMAVCIASAVAAAQLNRAEAVRTEIKMFEPWNPHGLSVGIAVQQKLSGKCFAESAASPTRPDAWRCSGGNAIQDPCYMQVMGDQKQLACAREPWSANVNLFTLEGSLPSADKTAVQKDDSLPWALELADGEKCTLMTGGTYMMAGLRANYGCIGGRDLFGDIDRSQPTWRIFSHTDKSIALTQNAIRVAWY
jgi:hypothetical protein